MSTRTIRIVGQRLKKYLNDNIQKNTKTNDGRRNMTRVLEDIGRILFPGLDDPRSGMYRFFKKQETIDNVPKDKVEKILEAIHGRLPLDHQKNVYAWSGSGDADYSLPSGYATWGEIEVEVQSSENLFAGSEVEHWMGAYVDKVKFRQLNKQTGEVKVAPGNYARIISPHGDGAVILPVDIDSGDVLLVCQFRHPQRDWILEAPRGFANPCDKNVLQVAMRELEEETGARPVCIGDREMIFPLKRVYTDTGKLTDKPGLFLAFVDRKLQEERCRSRGVVMEDPVWIPLGKFMQAVFSNDLVTVDEIIFVWSDNDRRKFFAEHLLDHGQLQINDMFTITTALLAMPLLKERFGEKYPSIWEWGKYRFVDSRILRMDNK